MRCLCFALLDFRALVTEFFGLSINPAINNLYRCSPIPRGQKRCQGKKGVRNRFLAFAGQKRQGKKGVRNRFLAFVAFLVGER
jgi:hypothetical protein